MYNNISLPLWLSPGAPPGHNFASVFLLIPLFFSFFFFFCFSPLPPIPLSHTLPPASSFFGAPSSGNTFLSCLAAAPCLDFPHCKQRLDAPAGSSLLGGASCRGVAGKLGNCHMHTRHPEITALHFLCVFVPREWQWAVIWVRRRKFVSLFTSFQRSFVAGCFFFIVLLQNTKRNQVKILARSWGWGGRRDF